MIAPINDRTTFRALSRQGRRAETNDLAARALPADGSDGGAPFRLAFAVGRPVGNAVNRNRLRRRLRALLLDRHRGPEGPLAGAYLVIARPGAASLTYAELGKQVDSMMTELARDDGETR